MQAFKYLALCFLTVYATCMQVHLAVADSLGYGEAEDNDRHTLPSFLAGLNVPPNVSGEESCGAGKGSLSGFVCSSINDPGNFTVITRNSSDFESIKELLRCDESPLAEKESKTGYHRWLTSVAIWVGEGLEMFILLEGSIQLMPEAKKQILTTAALTSVGTTGAIYGTGVVLAELGREIPESWIRLVEGLTKFKASSCVFGWAASLAAGVAGKKKLATAGLLMNVVSNTFRETGKGALVTLPQILDKEYSAAALPVIPIAIVVLLIKDFKFGTGKPYLQALAWGVTATLGAGLFSGAWHDFEKVAGESAEVWDIGKNMTVGDDYKILSHKNLPMAILAPFGYRPNPTCITVVSGLGYFVTITLISLYWLHYRTLSTNSVDFWEMARL